ncbi:MAG: fluoride efflux transporter FluC [Gleimia sp.]|jgi:CrcB protein
MLQIKPGFLVFVGAALGTLARVAVDNLLATAIGGISFSTIVVNVIGAGLMGALVATWSARRGMHSLWDNIKIFAGTGFLGSFTTYSAFALAFARNISHPLAFAVAIGTIAAGIVGAWLGTALVNRTSGGDAH